MDVRKLVSQMTLEEKATLCVGADFWHTAAVERLNIPKSMVSDGPHGLRKQDEEGDHLGINDSIKAVCFPAGCGTAASFNRELVTSMGEILGNECQAEGVSVILGPAMNIKRSPLCGRNFEYYSEDPLVASEMAGALVKGVQSRNVGTSVKHFLANNQEHRRMSSSSVVDERTLREIYLAAFEGAVRNQKPWTVMCSYNKINGVYAAENKKYLTDILRGEWGFDGYVVSDWGATNDRVADLEAGLDLEMPSSGESNIKAVIKAVNDGALKEEVLDTACERILNIVYRFEENRDTSAVFDREKDHLAAAKIAEETIVLLKNDDEILPLEKEQKVALIGEFAKNPRYQGGGSSHINSFKVTSAWEELQGNPNVTFAQGYETEKDEINQALIDEAVAAAKEADVAVIFAGLPDSFESEGYDRTHMNMPNCQNALINAVCDVQPNVVVVLHNGSPIEMPWIGKVKGVLESYLSGQGVGIAQAKILYGEVNPSAKLPETFPLQLQDNPSYLYYVGEGDVVEYREGVFVGYRYYEKKNMKVLFPFGHGLSYTKFDYSNLKLDRMEMTDKDELKVAVDITNSGKVAGKEVVQLYVAAPTDNGSETIRPVKELRGFDKVELQPSETKTVSFTLSKRSFSYWNVDVHDWWVETGTYGICIGASSSDIRLSQNIKVIGTGVLKRKYTLDTTIGDIVKDEIAYSKIKDYVDGLCKIFSGGSEVSSEAVNSDMGNAMVKYMPLRGMMSFGGIPKETLLELLEKLNA